MHIPAPRRKVSSKDKIETFECIVLYASDFFERIIGATLDAVENEFLIKSDISDSESNQLSSMTKALDVKKHKTKILQSFNDTFVQAFTNSIRFRGKTEEQEDFGISLMDEAEIQENLLVDNLAYRVSGHFQPLLQTITKGIVRISNELNALPEPLILSPAKIGGIFQKAIECLHLPFTYKPLIYNTLFNVGFGKLPELYCGILTLLMQSEIVKPSESPVAADPK